MPPYTLPYGQTTLSFELPAAFDVTVLAPGPTGGLGRTIPIPVNGSIAPLVNCPSEDSVCDASHSRR